MIILCIRVSIIISYILLFINFIGIGLTLTLFYLVKKLILIVDIIATSKFYRFLNSNKKYYCQGSNQ